MKQEKKEARMSGNPVLEKMYDPGFRTIRAVGLFPVKYYDLSSNGSFFYLSARL